MKEIHETFRTFKEDFPQVYARHEELGIEIHENSGPLPEKVRWLLKIAISGGSRHLSALETHITKAKEAGVTDEEIKHTLLLLMQTAGFPTLMEAYAVYEKMEGLGLQ
jgi:alkylhydroperoxidase/carboxymuconolactone decarboxylase family protein YurZ